MIIYQKAINSGSGNDVLLGGAWRLIANQCQHPGRMHMRAPGPSGLHGCCSRSQQPLPRGPPSAPPGYLSLTNEMIDTFNLELNLLTFSSEGDILTGGMGRGSRGKMDACLLTCPASSLPAAEHPGGSIRAAGAGPQARCGGWRSCRAGEAGRAPAQHHGISDKGWGSELWADLWAPTASSEHPGMWGGAAAGTGEREDCPGETTTHTRRGCGGMFAWSKGDAVPPPPPQPQDDSSGCTALEERKGVGECSRACCWLGKGEGEPGDPAQAAMTTSPAQGCVPSCSSAPGEGAPTAPSERGTAWAPHGSLGPGHPPQRWPNHGTVRGRVVLSPNGPPSKGKALQALGTEQQSSGRQTWGWIRPSPLARGCHGGQQ